MNSLTSLPAPDAQPITARLAAAGSRRAELQALLEAAPPGANLTDLRRLLLDANVAGKPSAVSRQKVWEQLRARYLLDPAIPEYRVFLQGMRSTSDPHERGSLCLLLFARSDRLFRELTLSCVSPLLVKPDTDVDSASLADCLGALAGQHGFSWTEETEGTICRHALSALKDFGVLSGGVRKRTRRLRPGTVTALFAIRLGRLEGLTDRQVLESRWFRLLGLSLEPVVELLYAANRSGALRFRMQADVVDLSLPPVEVG